MNTQKNVLFRKVVLLTVLSLIFCVFSCENSREKIAQQEKEAKAGNSALESAPDGMAVFRQRCVTCHGSDGNLGLNGAKHLSESVLPLEERIQIITYGKNLMTPFGALLSPAEIEAVATYTLTLKK